MKYLYLTIAILVTNILSAQVAIGKDQVDGNGILDFASEDINGIRRGLILPIVTNSSNKESGTIFLNAATRQVEYIDKDDVVVSMSLHPAAANTITAIQATNLGIGVVVTDDSIPTDNTVLGALKLVSNNKALILPKVTNPHNTISNPSPGMLVYDLESKSMAIFNGSNWSYFN